MVPREQGGPVGAVVTLREIYDAVLAARKDVADVSARVAALERAQADQAAPAYLRKLGYSLGLLAAGVAAGWTALGGPPLGG